ncbi:hypothetical protein [Anaerotruncus rubiinfantis]|uniref:hypothetical protein n=1 Tax=Anaerotruncus rubiinfantis TaxID=1720200 RepID=UPI000836DADF|nr:hypothetical protein [Anaerotruncus rubiinfantis]
MEDFLNMEGANEQEAADPAMEPGTEPENMDDPANEPEEGVNEAEPAGQPPEERAQYAAARREAETRMRMMQERMETLARARGFSSFEELERAVQQQEAEHKRQQYIEQYGIDPQAIAPVVREAVSQNPIVQEARQVIEQNKARQFEGWRQAQVDELVKQFPDAGVKSFSDIANLPNAQEVLSLWGRGIPLAKAYAAANLDTIAGKKAAAAKQAAINAINGRSHMTATAGGAGESVEIPPDKLAEFKRWNPGATDAEIQKFYQRHL